MDVIPYYESCCRPGSAVVKNQASCTKLAALLGGKVLSSDARPNRPALVFPFDPMPASMFHELYSSPDTIYIYGSVVPHENMADKAMLHRLVSSNARHPSWYSSEFSEACASAVLPGYTVFTYKDLHTAISLLKEAGHDKLVIKDPSSDRGRGQFCIEGYYTPLRAKSAIARLRTSGLVIEPLLPAKHLQTYSVGTLSVGHHVVSWIGTVWSEWHEPSQEHLFGGNKMIAVKGDLNALRSHLKDRTLRQAVTKSGLVHSQYSLVGVHVQRATYDVLCNTSSPDLFGVVDPSLRPSASTPGEIVALEYMIQQKKDYVELEMHYRRPIDGMIEVGVNEDVFVESEQVVISTRILSE